MPGASCACSTALAVELLKPKPISCSWLALTPLTMLASAVLRCDRFCTCEVNAAPKSSLKPLNSAPGSLVVSKTLMPRRSCGRRYWMFIGRPLVHEAFTSSAAFSSAVFSAGAAAGLSEFAAAAGGVTAVVWAVTGQASISRAVNAVAIRNVRFMMASSIQSLKRSSRNGARSCQGHREQRLEGHDDLRVGLEHAEHGGR